VGWTNVTFEVGAAGVCKVASPAAPVLRLRDMPWRRARVALNRLAPSYVSTPQGEVLVELRLDSDQEKAKLDVALLEGFPQGGARAALRDEARTADVIR